MWSWQNQEAGQLEAASMHDLPLTTVFTRVEESEQNPASGPGASDPGASDPGVSEPGLSDPGASDPGASGPGASDPGAYELGASDPGVSVRCECSVLRSSITDPSVCAAHSRGTRRE